MFNENISPRSKVLRQRFLFKDSGICTERAEIVTKAYNDLLSEEVVLKKAKVLSRLLNEMTVWIGKDELIVGNQGKEQRLFPMYPE
ncbi:MAG: pyruvate formate lyase family protein, partial [Sarcina sp.]